jgi:hypothetical protein
MRRYRRHTHTHTQQVQIHTCSAANIGDDGILCFHSKDFWYSDVFFLGLYGATPALYFKEYSA